MLRKRPASACDVELFAAGAAARRERARQLRQALAFADVQVFFEQDEFSTTWTTSVPIFSARANRPAAFEEAGAAAAERFPLSSAQLVERFYRRHSAGFRQRVQEDLIRAAGQAMSQYGRQVVYEQRLAEEAAEALTALELQAQAGTDLIIPEGLIPIQHQLNQLAP